MLRGLSLVWTRDTGLSLVWKLCHWSGHRDTGLVTGLDTMSLVWALDTVTVLDTMSLVWTRDTGLSLVWTP